MNAWLRNVTLTFVLAWALAPTAAVGGEPGDAGALFLRVGVGARAAAMGEAFIAVAQDASALYWNPAAMSPVLGTNVVLQHTEHFQSVRLEQAMLTHETDWGTLGLGFTGNYMDDLERRDNFPSAVPLGDFSVYDVAFLVGFSRYVTPNLAAGVTVKPIYERIDDISASGVAVDAGVYHVSQIKGVNFAAVVGNVGSPMKFDAEEFALPRYVKVGASLTRDVEAIRGGVLATTDIVFPNDGDARIHLGVEGNYLRRFFLRAGFKAGYESQGATFGLGVSRRRFGVDYAFLLIDNDLGNSHRFSLALSL